MDIPAQQLVQQKLYFDILLYGAILVLLRNCLNSFFSGIGQTRVVMFSALTAMLVNVAANYVLIFPYLGFPPGNPRGGLRHPLRQPVHGLLVLPSRLSGANQSQGVRSGFATLRWRGDAQAAALRLSGWGGALPQPARLPSMILLFHSHSLATATAVTIVFNWDMVSFVPLLGIQIGVVGRSGATWVRAGRRSPSA